MQRVVRVLSEAWAIAGPYWRGDERWRGRLLLGTVILLNLSLVGMSVVLSYWNREFFNALQDKDAAAFWALLFVGRAETDSGPMPGFAWIAALYIVIQAYELYLRQALQIRWRGWLTRHFMGLWLDGRAYYRLGLTDAATDNPDQRIAEDLRLFVDDTLRLGLGLMRSVVTLFSFVVVLWGLSGAMTLFGVEIPGYMVWVALIYAVLGTWLAHLIGRRLVGLNFDRQRREADFRYGLVRIRDNAEGIALHGGEADEAQGLRARFDALIRNWWGIMVATKRLTFFTSAYAQIAVVFPFVVAAPAYFAGRLPLGGLTQTAGAFSNVQESLSWFVDRYGDLAEWRATVARLTGFLGAVQAAQVAALAGQGPTMAAEPRDDLAIEDLTLGLPDGRTLLQDASGRIGRGETVLLAGASGSGKSTLFRAIAGLWPFGAGRIRLPGEGTRLFLPQRPYLPLGTLRRALCYPRDAAAFDDAALHQVLADVGLGHLAGRLDEEGAWSAQLSGGEQQRVALARALLLRPDWLFLDEATASLDPEAETHFYQLLAERLPGTTILSIAHRPAVAQYHGRALRLEAGRLADA